MAKIGKPKVRGPRKAAKKGDLIQIKSLIKHPMESGLRKDKATGKPIPAHFIEKVVVNYGGKDILKSTWTGAISKNPYFAFYVKAEASGPLTITWTDNKGESFSASAKIKVA